MEVKTNAATLSMTAEILPVKKYADHRTPLIKNGWYVAATADEVGRTMIDRWILGQNVLMYRTEEGRAVALDNRCPHRSFPLSKGRLEGGNVVCGYHGITYDKCGTCVRVPTIPRVPPNFGVRDFPLVERGPLLWIWMGEDASTADEALIPSHFTQPGSEGWAAISGYYYVKSDYVQMHENLQDLSHFGYLHADSLGAPDFASAPMELTIEGNKVKTLRTHLDAKPPALWSDALELSEDHRLSRIIEPCFEAPSHIGARQTMKISPRAESERSEYQIVILHYLTPDTQNSFHYHWFHLRNFVLDSSQMSDKPQAGYARAFLEDKDALEAITEVRARDARVDFIEHSFAADRPGPGVRRVIEKLAEAEA